MADGEVQIANRKLSFFVIAGRSVVVYLGDIRADNTFESSAIAKTPPRSCQR
jgi:hypothetical protein